MNKLLPALVLGAFLAAQGPVFAQAKPAEAPASAAKSDQKSDQKTDAKKEEPKKKKKEKKGGC